MRKSNVVEIVYIFLNDFTTGTCCEQRNEYIAGHKSKQICFSHFSIPFLEMYITPHVVDVLVIIQIKKINLRRWAIVLQDGLAAVQHPE